MKEKVLAYVKFMGKHTNNTYEYNLFFTETPEYVWGPDWDNSSPSSNEDITPDSTTYSEIKMIRTNLPLKTVEETSCYSMEYAIEQILPLAWIDIENLQEYPENGRMPLYFGETENQIKEKLNLYNWIFLN